MSLLAHGLNPREFPALEGAFTKTSEATLAYNCIAWAAGDQTKWWWPDPRGRGKWPRSAPREATIAAFIAAFETLGYVSCDDGDLESGFEKVAIYALLGVPTHAARQLSSGLWTSKMGGAIDLSHHLNAVNGPKYGAPVAFLKRPRLAP